MNTQEVFPSTNRATEIDLIQMELSDLELLPDSMETTQRITELKEKLRNLQK